MLDAGREEWTFNRDSWTTHATTSERAAVLQQERPELRVVRLGNWREVWQWLIAVVQPAA